MKKLLLIITILAAGISPLRAQSISYIEITRNWYYIYDQNGKRLRGISASQGELVAYSSSFYILKQGSSFYVTYTPEGKRIYAFSVSIVGEILTASGDTFTSRKGSWIYTWSKDGKKISTHAAQ